MTQGLGTIPTLLIRAAGYGDLIDQLNQDLADGKITLGEGINLAESLLPHIQQYLPQEDTAIVAAIADLLAAAYQAEQLIEPKVVTLLSAIKAAHAAQAVAAAANPPAAPAGH